MSGKTLLEAYVDELPLKTLIIFGAWTFSSGGKIILIDMVIC